MGSRRTSRLHAGLIGVLALAFAACSDGGTEPNVASGAVGELSLALDGAGDALASNEASFASAHFFAPFMASVLAGAAPAPPAVAPGLTAPPRAGIPEAVLGTTYDYDFTGGGYVATTLTGAPANGVRFLLYSLDSSGTPQPGSSIGYLDLTLTAVQQSTGSTVYNVNYSVSVVANSRNVFTLSQSGTVNVGTGSVAITGSGTLTSADGSATLAFEGGKSGNLGFLSGGFDFSLGPITATFGRAPAGGSDFFVTVVVRKQVGQTFDWTFSLFAQGDAGEQISGPLILADPDVGEGVFACVAGAFSSPDATSASNCSGGAYEIPGVGAAELGAVEQAYGALYDMWAALIGFLDAGLEVGVATVTGG